LPGLLTSFAWLALIIVVATVHESVSKLPVVFHRRLQPAILLETGYVTSLAKKPIQFLNREQKVTESAIWTQQATLDEAVHCRHRQSAEILARLSEFQCADGRKIIGVVALLSFGRFGVRHASPSWFQN